MALIKETVLPLGRPLFIPKDGTITIDDLIIETEGMYKITERPDCFLIINDECCKSMKIKVSTKD